MGISSPNIPNANYNKTIILNYQTVDDLYKKNCKYDKIVINYQKLDGNTCNLLRQVIADVTHNYSYPTIEKEEISEELKRIFVENMSDQVEIDYSKLAVHEDEGVDYALILRNYIQDVLKERKQVLYNNMLLNPTI